MINLNNLRLTDSGVVSSINGGGGGIFIYSCSQTLKIGTLGVHVSAQKNSMVAMKKNFIHNYWVNI